MAELGETADPRALVPGDPAVIGETVSRLRQYGRLLSEAGEGLRRIDDGGWTGQAADAFRDFFDGHPGEWIRSGDAFTSAADALEPYQRVLEWGQQQAAEAVRTWTEGRAATDRAAAAYEAESASRPPDSPPMPPFSDPGAEKRQHAESMLGLAREQVLNAAEGARSKVAEAKGDLVEARSWLGQLWHGLQDAGEGLVDHIAEYSDTVWKLDPARVWAEPGEVIDDLRNLPAAVQQASANSSAEDLIDLRQFRENPARAAGESVLRFGKLAGPWAVVTTPYQVVEQIQQMRAEKPKHHVFISEERHPESAAHAEDAQNGRTWRGGGIVAHDAEHPRDVTIDRENAEQRRRQAVNGVPARPRALGIDRDEYPPAVFEEGGRGSSVQYIRASDNRGSGSSMRHQMADLPNGTEVTINVR